MARVLKTKGQENTPKNTFADDVQIIADAVFQLQSSIGNSMKQN